MTAPTSREVALGLIERARLASPEPARRLFAEANVFATLAVEEAIREAAVPAEVVTLGDLTVAVSAPEPVEAPTPEPVEAPAPKPARARARKTAAKTTEEPTA